MKNVLYLLACLAMLTACSPKLVVNDNPVPGTAPRPVWHKEEVTLVFFNLGGSAGLDNHLSIYQRFADAFKDAEEVHVLKTDQHEVLEFKNYGYFYFHNNGRKARQGMILSNGVDKPVVVTNPARYIKAYESYFGVPFNDKVYYAGKRKAEVSERQRESRQILEKQFAMDQHYADQVATCSNTAFYPPPTAYPRCQSGRVTVRFFEDSARIKKSPVRTETIYDNNNRLQRYTMYMNDVLFSDDVYHRNRYNLIDSIVRTDNNGQRGATVFKYEKNRYSIVSVDARNVMVSNVFHLDDGFRCVRKETFNGSGDLVGVSRFTYDSIGRIAEETDATQKITYQYSGREATFTIMRLYSLENGALLTEHTRQQLNHMQSLITKNNGRVTAKSVSVTGPSGCIKTAYNYNADGKITDVYEYSYGED